MIHGILRILYVYFGLSLLLTIFMVAKMYIVAYRPNKKRIGRARRIELVKKGKWRQQPLYSMSEISENKDLIDVRITIFPNDSGEKGHYAIVLPGGGYAHCITEAEGYSIAAGLNELDITAVVLEYRTGIKCSSHAPMKDLARTVQFMTDHAEELNVIPEDYGLVGFSAGGNLAGIYGSEFYGYKKYGTLKPGALMIGYPWTNINHWMDHPYWNIWDGLIGIWFSERGNFFMFGIHPSKEEKESLCVQSWVDEGFPPTYMFTGDDDILVRSGSHTDVLHKAFKRHNVPYMYQQFYRVPHGVGLGIGTNAEGWLNDAVSFWGKNINDEKLEKVKLENHL